MSTTSSSSSSSTPSKAERVRILHEAYIKNDPSCRLPNAEETQRILDTIDVVIAKDKESGETRGRPLTVEEMDDLFDSELADLDTAQVAKTIAQANPAVRPQQRRVQAPSKRAHQEHAKHEKRRQRERAAKNLREREKLATASLARMPHQDMTKEEKARRANMTKEELAIHNQQLYQFQEWASFTKTQTERRRNDREVNLVQMLNQESIQWQRRAQDLYEDGLPAKRGAKGPKRTEPGEASRCIIDVHIPSESRWSLLTCWAPYYAVKGYHTLTDLDAMMKLTTERGDVRKTNLLRDAKHLVRTYDPLTEMVMCLQVYFDPVRLGDQAESRFMLLRMHKDDYKQIGSAVVKKPMCQGAKCWTYILLPQLQPQCHVCIKANGSDLRFCSTRCKNSHLKTAHADRPSIQREKARRQQCKKKKRQLDAAAIALLQAEDSRCEPDWANIPDEVRKGELLVDNAGRPILSEGQLVMDEHGESKLDKDGQPIRVGVGRKIYDKVPFIHTPGSLQFAFAKKRKVRAGIVDMLRSDLKLHPTFCLEGCTLFDDEE